jgi:predicted Zn-dependent protease
MDWEPQERLWQRRLTRCDFLLLASTGGAALFSSEYRNYSGVAEVLGGLGATALLVHYSREAEREGDGLGMAYAAKSGANPAWMVGLMEVLTKRPSAAQARWPRCLPPTP